MLDYVWGFGPENLAKLRLHTELFTGENLNALVFSNCADPDATAEGHGYKFAVEDLPKRYWISEPEIPGVGRIGPVYKGHVINQDLCRYQGHIANFWRLGMFDHIEANEKTTVLEIGAGYGAIGYHLLRMFPGKVRYIAVDLPLMLLFSGCYNAANADVRVGVMDPDADVVLVPPQGLADLDLRFDFAINTLSLTEMTEAQQIAYLDIIRDRLGKWFYYQNFPNGQRTHELLPERFLLTPRIDFVEKYMRRRRLAFHEVQYNLICTTEDAIHRDLKRRKMRLLMPDGVRREISL